MVACEGINDVHEHDAITLAMRTMVEANTTVMCVRLEQCRQASPLSCKRDRNCNTAFE